MHLHSQSGGKARFDDARACFVPGTSVQAERSAGACNGTFAHGACIAEGAAAGAEAARARGFGDGTAPSLPAIDDVAEAPLLPVWLVPSGAPAGRGPKQFVDLQNDVTAADIALAAREGYRSIEHVKRYTALGFGTDQGKLGNVNGMAILAQALGNDIAATGTTTFRPNYTPVTFGAIAGRDLGELFEPVRKTALHQWHEAQRRAVRERRPVEAPMVFPQGAARACTRRWRASAWRCATASASWTRPRSARSTSRARTPRRSSTGCTRTRGRSSASVAAATA